MNTRLQRRTPLRRVSKKRAAQNRTYTKKRKAFLIRFPVCQICASLVGEDGPAYRSEEVHHRNGRIGVALLDEEKWLAVCRDHHRKIHAEPKWARSRGWLL